MFEFDLLLRNLLQPPILFFILGLLAVWVRSDLDIAQPIPRFLSLLLLVAIGLKGGFEMSAHGLSPDAAAMLGAAIGFSILTPVYVFFFLRTRLNNADAAACAAAFGSVSAITFITAAGFLEQLSISYGGYAVAAMALMESPAIVVALLLYRLGGAAGGANGWGALLREVLVNSSVFALLGAFVVGLLTGQRGAEGMQMLTQDLFPVILAFFLLDMGLVAGRRMRDLVRVGAFAVTAALAIPLFNAALAIAVSYTLGLELGDALLLTVLAASASYIAVPAAMRLTLPEANAGVYVSISLAVVFPFNVLIGIPLYLFVIRQVWDSA